MSSFKEEFFIAKAKKLPSGNWRVQVYANGQRRSFTAPTKKEAELIALEWLNGKRGESDCRTVGECIDDYIKAKENILSPSTIDGYKRWKRNCLDSLCGIHLDRLTLMHVQKAMNELALTKSAKTVRNESKKISGTTVIAVPLTFTASYKTHIHNRQHEAEVPQPIREYAPSSGNLFNRSIRILTSAVLFSLDFFAVIIVYSKTTFLSIRFKSI